MSLTKLRYNMKVKIIVIEDGREIAKEIDLTKVEKFNWSSVLIKEFWNLVKKIK